MVKNRFYHEEVKIIMTEPYAIPLYVRCQTFNKGEKKIRYWSY